jgi:aminoglycoside N3'-acetyltransferase
VTVDDLRAIVAHLLGDDKRPILVSSALWPLTRALKRPAVDVVDPVIEMLIDAAGPHRTLIMPTLTKGFSNGFCDLDTEPSITGNLTEAFRRRPGVRRTASVFSSYSAIGPERDEFVELKIDQVWGEGSHLAWLEARNAHFLMLATHATHCVYLHRIEWLFRDRLPYRYEKVFTGKMRHEGREREVRERFFVRSLQPEVHQDFTKLLPRLLKGGMHLVTPHGISIAHMDADAMRAAICPAFEGDPLVAVSNPQDFARA